MAVDAFGLRQVGPTDLKVTQLGFGTATLGDMRSTVSEAHVSATIEAAGGARNTCSAIAPGALDRGSACGLLRTINPPDPGPPDGGHRS